MRFLSVEGLLNGRYEGVVVSVGIRKVLLGECERYADFEALLDLQNVDLSFDLDAVQDASDVVRTADELGSCDEIQSIEDPKQPQQMKLEVNETVHLLIELFEVILG